LNGIKHFLEPLPDCAVLCLCDDHGKNVNKSAGEIRHGTPHGADPVNLLTVVVVGFVLESGEVAELPLPMPSMRLFLLAFDSHFS